MLESSHGSLAQAPLGGAAAGLWPPAALGAKEAAGHRNLGNSGSGNPFKSLAINSGSMDAYASEEGLPPIPTRPDRAARAARDSMVFGSQGSDDSANSSGEADELEDTGADGTKAEPAKTYTRRETAILQVNNIDLESEREQDRQISAANQLASEQV